jgi:hypothetical protein
MTSFGSGEDDLVLDHKQHKYTFKLFLDYFGESIAEFASYNKREKRNNLFQHACTTSDEAFGIFTLERCWDTWFTEVSEHTKMPPRSSAFTKKNSNQKYCGWTKEGLQRYSDIAKLVYNSRLSDKRKNTEEEYRLAYHEQFLNAATNSGLNTTLFIDEKESKTDNFVPYNDLPKSHTNDDVTSTCMPVPTENCDLENSMNSKYAIKNCLFMQNSIYYYLYYTDINTLRFLHQIFMTYVLIDTPHYGHDIQQIDVTDENTATNSDYDSDTNVDRDRATMNTDSDDEDDDNNDDDDDDDDDHQYSQYANEYESPEDKFFESLNMSHAQNELLIGMDYVGQRDEV